MLWPVATDLLPLTDDVHWLFARLARSLGAAEHDAVEGFGISLREYVVLTEIAGEPGRSQLAVARAAAVDKSLMVNAVDRLESLGLVERVSHPTDRRVRALQVTPAGHRTLVEATAAVRGEQERLLATLPVRQRDTFTRALQTLARSAPDAGFDTSPCV